MKKGFFLLESFNKAFGLFILILIVVIFFIVFEFKKPQEFTISSEILDVNLELSLNNMFRTPILVEDSYITYRDLIELYFFDESYQRTLMLETQKIISMMEHYYESISDDKKYYSCQSTFTVYIKGDEKNYNQVGNVRVESYSKVNRISVDDFTPDCYKNLKKDSVSVEKQIKLTNGDIVHFTIYKTLSRI